MCFRLCVALLLLFTFYWDILVRIPGPFSPRSLGEPYKAQIHFPYTHFSGVVLEFWNGRTRESFSSSLEIMRHPISG